MRADEVFRWCPRPSDVGIRVGDSWTVERPLRDVVWSDSQRTQWTRRGQRRLKRREVRQILQEKSPRVVHAYDTVPHAHEGEGLDALLAHLEAFWAGRLHPEADIRVGEYRSTTREVLLMIEEDC